MALRACFALLQVRRIELSRTAASGAVDPTLILQLLLECELEGVTRLRCCEGMLPAWDDALFRKLEGLRILNLSSCQLSSLPSGIHRRMSIPCKLPVSAAPIFRTFSCLLSHSRQGMR